MAVTFDAVGPSATGGKFVWSGTPTWQHTVANQPNRLLLLGVALGPESGSDAVYSLSATYNGVAMDQVALTHSNNGTSGYVVVFSLVNPAVGTHDVVITVTGPDIYATVTGGSLSFYGVDQVTPLGTAVSSYGDIGSTFVSTVPAVDTGNIAAAFYCTGSPMSALTYSHTTRFIADQNQTSAAGNSACQTADGAGSDITMTVSSSNDWWGAVGLEVQQVNASGSQAITAVAATATAAARVPTIAGFTSVAITAVRATATAMAKAPLPPGNPGLAGTWFTRGSTPELVVNAEDWGLLCNAGLNHGGDFNATYDDYFATKQAQGYNSWYGSWCSFTGLSGGANGADSDGTYPFATTMDPTTAANTTFWARRDYFLNSANSHQFRVFLNVTTPYLHHSSPDTPPQRNWTNAQWSAFGTFLGNRYKDYAHIHWMMGDDYWDDINPGFDAFLSALRAAGANQPVSIQYYQESTSRYSAHAGGGATGWGSNAQFNWGYSYNPSYSVVEQMAAEANPIPYFWADGYFLTMASSPLTDVQLMRRMIWWALSSGSRGFTVGDDEVWPWYSTSLAKLTSKTFYTQTVGTIASYFSSLPNWHKLVPDSSSQLVTSGRGTHVALPSGDPYYGAGGSGDSDNYVSASRTPDGSLAVIYMSKGSTITIDESKLGAGYTATWVDPNTCATSAATPGTTYNSTAKGTNSDGLNEWLLVLQGPALAGSSVAGVAATVTATAQAPVVAATRSASVSAVSTTATATARVPVVAATGSATVNAVSTTATATARVPVVAAAGSASVSAVSATATATARLASVAATRSASVSALSAMANATALLASVAATSASSVMTVRAQASTAALAPVLRTGATITAVKAMANASAPIAVVGGPGVAVDLRDITIILVTAPVTVYDGAAPTGKWAGSAPENKYGGELSGSRTTATEPTL